MEEQTGDQGSGLTPTTQDPNPIRGGLRCPECNCPHHYVTKTIQSESSFWGKKKQYITRYRICRHCQLSFKTREVIVPEVPKQVRSPIEAAQVREKLNETMGNVLPELPPNPYL